ncbi:MAG: DNA mismatch repair endonuclease MutH [Algicola sp.]|nr:DNA mismatch repair endonuclease MutH [Algicola sp.]
MHRPAPPQSKQQLLERAQAIAGLNLAELATRFKLPMPQNLKREKGWVGQLIEFVLGADAGSKPVPDFIDLNIELKTLPISHIGEPLETTFVCVAPLTGITGVHWHNSHFRNKIRQVLWVPILAERQIPLAERVVGTPFMWQLEGEHEQLLKQDWEELMDLIVLGDVTAITAKTGQYLQLRPKAAHSRIMTEAFDLHGNPIKSQPKGFYLKKEFTRMLLAQAFS